jgi:hypothetical protein
MSQVGIFLLHDPPFSFSGTSQIGRKPRFIKKKYPHSHASRGIADTIVQSCCAVEMSAIRL